MRAMAWAVLALMVMLALSGCGSKQDDGGGDGTTTGPGGTRTGTGGPGGTGTGTGGTGGGGGGTGTTTGPGAGGGSSGGRLAHLSASIRNGTAPLMVTFSVRAEGGAASRWSLDFGDGQKRNGASLPGSVVHNYTSPGTFIAELTVNFDTGNPAKDSLSIGVLPSTAKEKGYKLNTTATYAAPGGLAGIGCLRDVADPTNPVACGPEQAKAAYEQNPTTNGTWFRWYNIPVDAGSAALQIIGGSRAAQTCTPDVFKVCNPDYDFGIWDPAGALTTVGTADALEVFEATAPAAGTWSLVITYFAGAPNATGEVNIVVY